MIQGTFTNKHVYAYILMHGSIDVDVDADADLDVD